MFATARDLQTELQSKEPRSFVSRYIFDAVPHIFSADLDRWIEWKQEFADLIEVDARNVVVTGSASVGFSLNPKKGFKAYDGNSDVDCGVISSYHFDQAWRHLRQQQAYRISLPPLTKAAIRDHRERHIFAGTIATDWMLSLLPFGPTWQAALDLMAEVPPTDGRTIRLRIYRDYDSLRSYQSRNIGNLRDSLLAGRELIDAEDIPVALEE